MTLIYGHRGARGEAPENTLAGFRRAIDVGVLVGVDVGVLVGVDVGVLVGVDVGERLAAAVTALRAAG